MHRVDGRLVARQGRERVGLERAARAARLARAARACRSRRTRAETVLHGVARAVDERADRGAGQEERPRRAPRARRGSSSRSSRRPGRAATRARGRRSRRGREPSASISPSTREARARTGRRRPRAARCGSTISAAERADEQRRHVGGPADRAQRGVGNGAAVQAEPEHAGEEDPRGEQPEPDELDVVVRAGRGAAGAA